MIVKLLNIQNRSMLVTIQVGYREKYKGQMIFIVGTKLVDSYTGHPYKWHNSLVAQPTVGLYFAEKLWPC